MLIGVAACAGTAGAASAGTAIAGGPVPRTGTRLGLWHATRFAPQQRSKLAALLLNAAHPVPGRPARSVALSGIASVPIANPKTKTVYVPIQNSDVVDVINAAACNSRRTSGCHVVAKAKVGMFGPKGGPLAAVADLRTDTVYVVNAQPTGDGTVTVFNGARCNAVVTSGCSHVIATIKVGKFPVAATFDPLTRTVYVANLGGGTISVIDAGGCNALTPACLRPASQDLEGPARPGLARRQRGDRHAVRGERGKVGQRRHGIGV